MSMREKIIKKLSQNDCTKFVSLKQTFGTKQNLKQALEPI